MFLYPKRYSFELKEPRNVGSASFSRIESYLDAWNVVSATRAHKLGVGIPRKSQAYMTASVIKGSGNSFTNRSEFRLLHTKTQSLYKGSVKK